MSGLTCAIALQEAGFRVHLVAASPPTNTTSMIAAAVWTVPGTGPGSRSFRWALQSREVFAGLAADPSTGVSPLVQRELEVEKLASFGCEASAPWVRKLREDELPEGYQDGWRIEGFRIDPTVYLPWMLARFEAAGGEITWKQLDHLDEAETDVVVNCTGLGARELCGDKLVVPVRGQVVAVRMTGIEEGISDEHDPERIRYVYPRSAEVILGGTREVGQTDLSPDPAITSRILSDCRELVPDLSGAEFIEARVGLRPGRPEVRVEVDHLADSRPVVHNYGHGGQGFILSWGCAAEVIDLVRTVFRDGHLR